ncbi:hypothetical protein POJ06DRAFT_131616 [Lipomyces tetrasporus]|uniref:DUF2433 domain-containing protein n=1 Tax=Lipomyces tetrasporus TaxID=54092 RepID=A0AAD7QQ69_9ASCO|nr:uncharacterized protein POJ06DRAFT_131616 [Lipomyces tetrasporus]KAJ8099256.1 hypothetical protein POJ06DRAFT_131616 [Lipomyces tetrasporus]
MSTTNGATPQVLSVGDKARILCVADVRGQLSILNQLAKEHNASFIIHTGDFGFYDRDSVPKVTDKTLRHVAQYSPLLDARSLPQESQSLRHYLTSRPISQLYQFLSGELKFDVPVYTVHGACEDVSVLEKFRSGEYKVNNLFVVDEHCSRSIDTGNGVKFRLLGLGGALVMHKLFDNGSGRTTIAGGGGTTWTTLLQIGELIDTAARVFDETETRILVTHASPAREGILAQLALAIKADFSISGGLHFRYGCSYNEFAVNPTYDYFRGKLAGARAQFMDVWDIVKGEVQPVIANNQTQKQLIENALTMIEKMPTSAQASSEREMEREESANVGFRNMWHFNLTDVSYGSLVLDVKDGKISTETKSEGFNFKYRRPGTNSTNVAVPTATAAAAVKSTSKPSQPRKGPSPASNGIGPTPTTPAPAVPAAAPQKPVERPKSATPAPAEAAVPLSEEAPVAPATEEGKTEQKPSDRPAEAPSEIATEGKITGIAPPPADLVAKAADEKDTTREPRRPGLWVARADDSEETLKTYFAAEDQSHITSVLIRIAQTGKKFAYVYFDTQENAMAALPRVDQEKLGKVTPISDSASRGGRGFGASGRGGSWRSGSETESVPRRDPHRGRVSGGSRTLARGRGGRGRGGPGIGGGDGDSSAGTPSPATATSS